MVAKSQYGCFKKTIQKLLINNFVIICNWNRILSMIETFYIKTHVTASIEVSNNHKFLKYTKSTLKRCQSANSTLWDIVSWHSSFYENDIYDRDIDHMASAQTNIVLIHFFELCLNRIEIFMSLIVRCICRVLYGFRDWRLKIKWLNSPYHITYNRCSDTPAKGSVFAARRIMCRDNISQKVLLSGKCEGDLVSADVTRFLAPR